MAERHVSDYLSLWDTQTRRNLSRPRTLTDPRSPSKASWRRRIFAVTRSGHCRSPHACSSSRTREPRSAPWRDSSGRKRGRLLTVQAMHRSRPLSRSSRKESGSLNVKSTPSGAEAILDGKNYGRTPVTIPDLDVGLHTLVLKSASGSITRKVTIKANQTTLLTEAIFSGWLAIFSPIPVSVTIDGQPVNLTDDARVMTVRAGTSSNFATSGSTTGRRKRWKYGRDRRPRTRWSCRRAR